MIKIKKIRQIDVLFLGVFIAYLFDIGNIKYVLAFAFVGLYILLMALYKRSLPVDGPGKPFITITLGVAVLVLITVFKQLFNGFQSYAINETIYFMTPVLLVWVYASNTDKDQFAQVLNIIFWCCVVHYLLAALPRMTLENLKNISFASSYSPFESGSAHLFLVFEWLFFLKGEKKKAIFACLLSILGFKRFCIVAAILLLIFSKWLTKEKPISRKWLFAISASFILLPILWCGMLSTGFSEWFSSQFGVSLDAVSLSRSTRVTMLLESNATRFGLGSSTVYLTEVYQVIHSSDITQWNLHNDVVRIFLECGLLGSIAFTCAYFRAVSFSRPAVVLMVYIFAESFLNHLFGAGSVTFWIVVYAMIAYASALWQSKESQPDGL